MTASFESNANEPDVFKDTFFKQTPRREDTINDGTTRELAESEITVVELYANQITSIKN